MKTTNAKLKYTHATIEMEITQDNENLWIKSKPIKVSIGTFEAQTRCFYSGGKMNPF